MTITTTNYQSNTQLVSAAVITEQILGEIVQTLYDNGATHIALNSYITNPLNSANSTVNIGMIVFIRAEMYSVTIGDYVVSKEVVVGENPPVGEDPPTPIIETQWFLMSKEAFEYRYSPVV